MALGQSDVIILTKQQRESFPLLPNSDEVESWVFLLETNVRLWWCLASTSSLTDHSGKSVSVSDDWWLLDGSWNVVVSEAKLVGQRFDQMRRVPYGVIDHGVPSWSTHSLLGSYWDKIKLIDVLVSDLSIDNRSRKRVRESANITAKESCVNSLLGVDVHELSISQAQSIQSLLDLVDLSSADSLNLSLTNSVSVEDDLCWVCAIGSLEGFACSIHSFA